MFNLLRQTLLIFVALTLLTGVVYPLIVTVMAHVVFPHEADGSLIEHNGNILGSELIGQHFDDPKYFWSRPSATSPAYNGGASTCSNLGPTNPAQLEAVRGRAEAMRKANDQTAPVPADMVTASGSGLDPHISPAAAEYQVERIAKTRAMDPQMLRDLVQQHTSGRTFGLLGEPRVHVVQLNVALGASK